MNLVNRINDFISKISVEEIIKQAVKFPGVKVKREKFLRKELKKYCSKVYSCHPGEMTKIEKIFTENEIKQVTFLGKVHKRVLLQLHKFDKRAVEILKSSLRYYFKQ